MTDIDEKRAFWNSFLRSVETQPHEVSSLQGVSGFYHPVVAIGVDERNRRVVLISGEADARSAALAHGDIQATMPSVKLIMARPAPVNLGQVAQIVSDLIGNVQFSLPEHLELIQPQEYDTEGQPVISDVFKELIEKITPFVGAFKNVSLNMVAVWKEIIQQISLVEVEGDKPLRGFGLKRLITYDPVSMDRILGVCSIPLYDFTQEDVEVFQSGKDIEAAKQILKQLDVFQYFYPAPDQLALGFVDQSKLSVSEIVQSLEKTPEVGHPFGQLEIVDSTTSLRDVVDALQDMGLVVDGELGFEITPEGATYRSLVKFKPREGLLSLLSRIFSIKVDLSLKDLLK